MNISRKERARGRLAGALATGSAAREHNERAYGAISVIPCRLGAAISHKALVLAAVGVAFGAMLPASTHAQETQVAADQTPTLPPVVVFQPKTVTPASAPRARREAQTTQTTPSDEASGTDAAEGTGGAGTGGSSAAGIFSLGGINLMGGTVVTNDQTWTFQKPTLDQAAALAPGVSDSNGGGTRNERLLYVRGFDRYQVPLTIDGVRVYLPADNRLDFGRFLTGAEIAEIQIAKGYASVLDGPGGLGGAINLVTRRPTKELEGEVEQTFTFAGDGAYSGFRTSGYVGTKQKYYYLTASGSVLDSKGWKLSDDFKPHNSASEDGGWRNNSDVNDWRINVKAGITPNATDEYSISYLKQEGSKGAPFHTVNPINNQRYWDWPWWNLDSVYSHTTTRIGQSSYVNTKFFYNTFDNGLFSYDNQYLNTQTTSNAFRSYYKDEGYGGSIDAGTDITNWDTLKAAFHYRRDIHEEYNRLYVNGSKGSSCGVLGTDPYVMTAPCTEPVQRSEEDTYSIALENTFHATPRVDLVTGASYDWRNLLQAQDWTAAYGLFDYTLKDSDAWNWQAAAIWRYSDDAKVYANVSHRTRFPTLFERFSSRFGGATSNPALAPEESTNFEVGWAGKLFGRAQVSTAVFYSDVTDFIQSVNIAYNGGTYSQSQNIGDGEFYGWEGSADVPLTKTLSVGGNVTLIQRNISNPTSGVELTGVPDAKGIAYVKWSPLDGVTLTPNVEMASTRWTSNSSSVYYTIGAYTIANISAEYEFRPGATLQLTARNLTDENYALTDGFPEPGRSFTAGMRIKF
ncbi:TonB-dependent receptor [Rhodomicrobium vannielii ATCC 17100]|uniref:TonB-dependent receptor plug domain-containing protein n=1 Tax=Rhodomicrobium vannielii TaxID=1069 RepID=UPI00191A9B4B|nr:TonB-dependent receptor [Rhodomicrobium vannielii]MBJ7534294.1 TonB-dependent receptor [Rhodomicrobium vannielii ATCC 17100]